MVLNFRNSDLKRIGSFLIFAYIFMFAVLSFHHHDIHFQKYDFEVLDNENNVNNPFVHDPSKCRIIQTSQNAFQFFVIEYSFQSDKEFVSSIFLPENYLSNKNSNPSNLLRAPPLS